MSRPVHADPGPFYRAHHEEKDLVARLGRASRLMAFDRIEPVGRAAQGVRPAAGGSVNLDRHPQFGLGEEVFGYQRIEGHGDTVQI